MPQELVFPLILLSAAGWFARVCERSKVNEVAQLRALGERGAAHRNAAIVIRHEPIRLHPAEASRNRQSAAAYQKMPSIHGRHYHRFLC
jgi:hypothetical protein